MAVSLHIPKVVYQGPGRCIICLKPFTASSSGDNAPSLEHIIPEYLCRTGEIVIKDGTCVGCNNAANKRFEQPAANADFKVPRILLDLKRKKRSLAKKRKLQLPAIALGNLPIRDDDFNVYLTNDEYPNFIHLYSFKVAGKIANIDRGGELEDPVFIFLHLGEKPTQIKGKFTIETVLNHTAYSLTLAKIAYCFAVAEIGLDAFNGNEIRSLLKGERSDTYNFVGGLSVSERLNNRFLHKLYIRYRGNLVTVIVHLFASYKMIPYEVVVGERL